MDIRVVPYTKEWENKVAEFNRRLKQGGSWFQFPESWVSAWLPKIDDRRIYQEYFLAVDDAGAVHGAYILKFHDTSLFGKIATVCAYGLPLSEGSVDRAYKAVGPYFLRDAMARQPLLFSLGMGGLHRPAAKALARDGWSVGLVPFYFRIVRPARFLKNIKTLRSSAMRRLVFDLLAISGLGWAAVKVVQWLRGGLSAPRTQYQVERIASFGSWADEIWNATKDSYAMATIRDAETLNILYPEERERFVKMRVVDGDKTVGWAVGLNTQMTDHKQFGAMRVGSIIDCLALSGCERDVIAAVSTAHVQGGADILVSNQSFAAWGAALRRCGFMKGPSNFVLGISPELARAIGPLEDSMPAIHINRTDGGGPINL